MHQLYLVGAGILIGLIVAAPIGPVNLICMRRTLAYGPVNGFFSGLGAALGDGVFASVSGFGLTVIGQLIEGYSIALTLAGGAMLLGFGVHIFRSDVSVSPNPDTATARAEGSLSLLRTVASTFALTITNPATLFGFTALFAGLGSLAGEAVLLADAAAVVSGVVAGSVLWWFTLAVSVGIFHRYVSPTLMRRINHVFGVVVGGFGVVVLGGLIWRLL